MGAFGVWRPSTEDVLPLSDLSPLLLSETTLGNAFETDPGGGGGWRRGAPLAFLPIASSCDRRSSGLVPREDPSSFDSGTASLVFRRVGAALLGVLRLRARALGVCSVSSEIGDRGTEGQKLSDELVEDPQDVEEAL